MSISVSLRPRPVVIANWKMYLGITESGRLARTLRSFVARRGRGVDLILCPTFPALPLVREILKGSRIYLGAQDVHQDASGPHTGDVSVEALHGLVRHVIVGHSERRRAHGETDEIVAAKVRRAVRAGLHPIICVGETAEERSEGQTVSVIRRQVEQVLERVPALSLSRCIIAYEPVWAISAGVGRPSEQPEPADAAHVMGLIRRVVADRAGRRHADRIRVVYGGSVNSLTVEPFVSEPGVDGVLVGAASTSASEVVRIVQKVLQCRS